MSVVWRTASVGAAALLSSAAVSVALVAGTPAAFASTASVIVNYDDERMLIYQAGAREANQAAIRIEALGVTAKGTIVDAGAAVTAGAGCVRVDSTTVECVDIDIVQVNLGDGNDTVELADVSARRVWVQVFSGPGADTFHGCDTCRGAVEGNEGDDVLAGGGAFSLDGGPGNDTLRGSDVGQELRGGPGNDIIDGAGGNDVIFPERGDDLVDGGSGRDRVWYCCPSASSRGVTVDLRRQTATGSTGRDSIIGIEDVTGTAFRDVLIGDANANRMDGFDGVDVIRGRAGADVLSGGLDEIGTPGFSDTIYGGAGDDQLVGRQGNDLLDGGEGRDRLDGGSGADSLRAADGERDRLFGGRGPDRARVDRGIDTVRAVECVTGRNAIAARACRMQLAG